MSKSALRHFSGLAVLVIIGLLVHPAIASGQMPVAELARSGDCLESRDCPPIRSGCTPGVGQPICNGIDTDCNGVVDQCASIEFLGALGRDGIGAGELRDPIGLVLDADDNVYVANSVDRVEVFDSSGQFRFGFGGLGRDPGQFFSVIDVALGADGAIYVLESGSGHRVQKFSATGEFLLAFDGAGGPGELVSPWGIAVDPQDNIYVSDLSRDEIVKFGPAGQYLLSWGGLGTAPGQFRNPRDIVWTQTGTLLVTESSNSRVQEFDSNGGFVSTWGQGPGPGTLFVPLALALDASGNVYVSDINGRVLKFDSGGGFLAEFPVTDDSFFFGVGVEQDGTIIVSSFDPPQLLKLDPQGVPLGVVGRGFAEPGELVSSLEVAVDSTGNLFVVDREERISKIDASGQPVTGWGGRGSGPGQFDGADFLAVDMAGNVYISDALNDRVQKFDTHGRFLLEWGHSGDGPGQFFLPRGIATDSIGNVIVADQDGRVQLFDLNGDYRSEFTAATDELWGIAADAEGHLLLVDRDGQQVLQYSIDGILLNTWSSPGTDPGQLDRPDDIVAYPAGGFAVLDRQGIQRFSADGSFVERYVPDIGRFDGIGIDGDGVLYGAEAFSGLIHRIGCRQSEVSFPDADRDGFGAAVGATAQCGLPEGFARESGDCDDADPAVHPAASELCDGIDNDCDLIVDEQFPTEGLGCDPGPDGCPTGGTACLSGTISCAAVERPETCSPRLMALPDPLKLTIQARTDEAERLQILNTGNYAVAFELGTRLPESCAPESVFLSWIDVDTVYRFGLESNELDAVIVDSRPNNNNELSRDGKRLYTVNSYAEGGRVRVTNLETGRTSTVGGDVQVDAPVGLALNFDETVIYVSQDLPGQVQALDISTGALTLVADELQGAQGLALNRAETKLYVVHFGRLSEIDLTTGAQRVVTQGFFHAFDVVLSRDESRALISDNQGGNIFEVNLQTGGRRTIAINLSLPDGLALGPFGENLFVATYDGLIGVNLDSLATTQLTTFPATGVTIVADRRCRTEFITFAPSSGVVPPRGNTGIAAQFDALDLNAGIYEMQIVLQTDDPVSPHATSWAELELLGRPELVLDAAPIDFGSAPVGGVIPMTLAVSNPGTDTLALDLSTDHPAFRPRVTALHLAPETSDTIEVRFTPNVAGMFSAALEVESNDPQRRLTSIPLNAMAFPAPLAQLNPEPVQVALQPGSSRTVSITLSNAGVASLSFDAIPSPKASAPDETTHCEPEELIWGGFSGLEAYDLASGTTRTLTGVYGRDVEIRSDQTAVYVADLIEDTIWSYDLVSGETTVLTDEVRGPYGLVEDPDSGTLYTTQFVENLISAVSPKTGKGTPLSAGFFRPSGIALDPEGGGFYFTSVSDDLLRYSFVSGELETILAGTDLFRPNLGLSIDAERGVAYVVDGSTVIGRVSEMDLRTGIITPIVTGLYLPRDLVVNGRDAWVNEIFGVVSHIDLDTGELTELVASGGGVEGMALRCSTFITPSPASGSVRRGESIDLQVEINAGDLPPATYGATLTLRTNDPLNRSIAIPFTLIVQAPTSGTATGGLTGGPDPTVNLDRDKKRRSSRPSRGVGR